MKTARKVLIIALCAVLLVSISVMGTMAYLTSQASVTNTFTVGKVGIELDEALVDANGKEITDENAKRVKENKYKLLPGLDYDKDPTIHVADDSENCWLFVKVENGIAGIEAASENTETGYKNITDQIKGHSWTQLVVNDKEVPNVYYKSYSKTQTEKDLVVFDTFKINGAKDADDIAAVKDAKITVTAYAVQADGFDNASDAWTIGLGK